MKKHTHTETPHEKNVGRLTESTNSANFKFAPIPTCLSAIFLKAEKNCEHFRTLAHICF